MSAFKYKRRTKLVRLKGENCAGAKTQDKDQLHN